MTQPIDKYAFFIEFLMAIATLAIYYAAYNVIFN